MVDIEKLKARLRGVLAFPITPYAPDGSIDLAAVRGNLEWVIDSGVCAVVAPSGTGEFFALAPDECAEVTRATVEAVAGRMPVVASVGFGPEVGAHLARSAEAAGADAILVLPPYYARPDPLGLLRYYQRVAEATRLGLMVYARDGALLTPELVEQLAREIPTLVGFKDGLGDVRLFGRIREHVVERLGRDRMLWLSGAGDDLVGPYFAAGAQGFTSSLACFWPEVSVELYRLAAAGDVAGLRELHERAVRPFYELRRRRNGFEVSVMKAAMELLGHPAGPARPPLANLSGDERAELGALLELLGVPTAAQRRAALRGVVVGGTVASTA